MICFIFWLKLFDVEKNENYGYTENKNYGYTEIFTYLHLIRSDIINVKFKLICAIKLFKLNHVIFYHTYFKM